MTIEDKDTAPMRAAIAASRAAMEAGNMPFGATLVSAAGAQLLVAQNNQVTSDDCTGHAETVLVREAAAKLGPDALKGATVYASGEPCAMCAGAMFWAGITRVVFAASQDDICTTLGGATLPIGSATVLAGATPPVMVDGPLLGAEALAVLRDFAQRA
jgi:tRNA(Arg) A34 adenosine deaminase TadA